jgi:hypothetical protein
MGTNAQSNVGDLHEVYVKNEKGDMIKVDEVRGNRAAQVRLRRDVRARMGVDGNRIVLYTNGKLHKVGIDRA